jgi:hypothetical protein
MPGYARRLLHDHSGNRTRAARDRSGSLPTHSSSLLYRLSHHAARIWAQLYELVESAGPYGMCADQLQLPYPCGRARPAGASGPAVSGVHTAHKTAHPLCTVTEDKVPSRSAHSLLISGHSPGKWHALLFYFFAHFGLPPLNLRIVCAMSSGMPHLFGALYVHHSMPIPQMWSDLLRYFPIGAHD